jgi:hypothetical protein
MMWLDDIAMIFIFGLIMARIMKLLMLVHASDKIDHRPDKELGVAQESLTKGILQTTASFVFGIRPKVPELINQRLRRRRGVYQITNCSAVQTRRPRD